MTVAQEWHLCQMINPCWFTTVHYSLCATPVAQSLKFLQNEETLLWSIYKVPSTHNCYCTSTSVTI